MNGNRQWLGWFGIGLGVLALLIALTGRGFGPQMIAGIGSSTMPQANAQQHTAPQSGAVPPGANAQQGAGRVRGDQQSGAAARGGQARQDGGRRGNEGFGGGWFSFPFKLFGNVTRLGLLALLIVLGVWLIRGRRPSGTASARPAEPVQGQAPEQRSPTGESYTDEPDTAEPRDQV
jgi:hypothetical protein